MGAPRAHNLPMKIGGMFVWTALLPGALSGARMHALPLFTGKIPVCCPLANQEEEAPGDHSSLTLLTRASSNSFCQTVHHAYLYLQRRHIASL